MNKKAQIVDTEILYSTGFVILCVLALGATLLGYIMGKRMDLGVFPIWQLIIIMVAEVVASYIIVARG